MDVKIYPFSVSLILDSQNNLSKDGFVNYLTYNSNNMDVIYDKERVLVLQNISDSNYIAGVLLSFRDYDAHCKVVPDGRGGYSATIETIDDGAEYNFFVLNKNTFKGLWLTYFNAASISVLDKILRKRLNGYADCNGIEVGMKFKLKNKVRVNMIISSETLMEALSNFNNIYSIEYTELNKQQHYFSPDTINIKKTKLSLKRNNIIDNARNSIRDLFESGEAEDMRVVGKNSHGKIERINLDTIFRPWTVYDYDEITRTLQNFNTNNLLNHDIITKLMNCVNNNARNRRIIEQ